MLGGQRHGDCQNRDKLNIFLRRVSFDKSFLVFLKGAFDHHPVIRIFVVKIQSLMSLHKVSDVAHIVSFEYK